MENEWREGKAAAIERKYHTDTMNTGCLLQAVVVLFDVESDIVNNTAE